MLSRWQVPPVIMAGVGNYPCENIIQRKEKSKADRYLWSLLSALLIHAGLCVILFNPTSVPFIKKGQNLLSLPSLFSSAGHYWASTARSASFAQVEFFSSARPTPIRSAFPCCKSSSAAAAWVMPPVRTTGTATSFLIASVRSAK